MDLENNDRFPIILLDYSQRHLAYKKELLFDYKTGRLYVVSAEDKSVIFDITKRIVDLINSNISGDNLIVTVQGIGRVNLTQYADFLKNNTLHANRYSGGKTLIPAYVFDNDSIVNRDGVTQLNNFWSASKYSKPYKDSNGLLKWDNDRIYTVSVSSSKVTLKEEYNVSSISGNISVVLNYRGGSYGPHVVINWKVDSTSNSTISFPSSVKLENSGDNSISSGGVNIYRLETWDKGSTWYESVKKYS